MPLVLTDVRTDAPRKPIVRPIIGSGQSDDGGKVMVALLAPLPPAWVVFPLSAGVACRVGDEPLAGPRSVRAGDTLALGRKAFRVAEATADGPPPADEFAPPECEVVVRFRGAELGRTTIAGPLLIGTADDCGLVLSGSTGLSRHYAVMAYYDARWHLFGLAEAGLAGDDDAADPVYHIPLVRDQSVWLGDVELTARYEETDPLDRAYPAPEPVSPYGAAADTAKLHNESETETDAVPADPAPSSGSSNWRPTAVHADRDNTVHLRGLGICQWLQAEHQTVAPLARPAPVSARPFPLSHTPTDGRAKDLDRLSDRLTAAPWDTALLFELATYFRGIGMGDNARWVLKELYRQNPGDPVVTESLAVLSWQQSRDRARPADVRTADLKRAYKYITLAARLCPKESRIQDAQRAIGADLTLRR